MRTLLPVILFVLLLLLAAGALWRERRLRKRLYLRVQKLYASQLFEDMMPLLHFSGKQHIEQITVDKTGVVFRYLHIKNNEAAFLMRPHGYRYLSPEQQEAMRVVLEKYLPQLRDHKCYHFYRRHIRLLNGQVEYVYLYTILNAYKSSLMRASFLNSPLKTPLW